jgi:hypothetical protein
MRIAKELNHRGYKVTIMVMNGKYNIKVEKDLLEQTYKFRQGSGMDTLDRVIAALSDSFYDGLDPLFTEMSKIRKETILDNGRGENEFEEII